MNTKVIVNKPQSLKLTQNNSVCVLQTISFNTAANIKKTSLFDEHIKLNAKMLPFAGYEMPINYSKGIQYEYDAVRNTSGVFDVSHMGQIIVEGTELTNDSRSIDRIRGEVGMVFQQFNLFPHLSILDNVTLAPIWVRKLPKAQAKDKAMEYLKRVQIDDQAR